MKSAFSLVVAGLVAIAFAQHAHTRSLVYTAPISAQGARKVIESQLAKYRRATENKDIKGIQAILTPDFTAVGASGRTTKGKDMLDQMGQIFMAVKKIRLSVTILSFKLVNDKAVVVCHNVSDLDLAGQQGLTSKYHGDTKVKQTWVPSGGTYKLQFSKELSGKRTLDGKPLPGN